MKGISIDELIAAIKSSSKMVGAAEEKILYPEPINIARSGAFSFCSAKGDAALKMIRSSKASVIICSEDIELNEHDYQNRMLIMVSNPRLAFIKVLKRYFVETPVYEIHPTAIIHESAKIASNVKIGPYSYLGESEIGEGSIIHGNVYIYSNVKIGKGVIIYPGAVIGRDGYGFERNENGILERFPQISGVIIQNNVEIGANTVIDRGALSNTVIGEGTKIDNLCHIAHGVTIGKHCLVIASSVIGGSTKIGDNTHIAPAASLLNNIRIGENVVIGMGSVVIDDVPDNSVVAGVPAKRIRENI